MKITKDPAMLVSIGWAVLFFGLGFVLNRFYLFPVGLFPIAVYEFIRTEGKKNTKPLSLIVGIILVLQFLHVYKLYVFPFDLNFLTGIFPVSIPAHTDKFVFLSTAALVVCSILLIKYTWGSVTKFLAILLLAGSLLMAFTFWAEIRTMLNSPEGKQLMEGSQEEIKDNIYYRIRRELSF